MRKILPTLCAIGLLLSLAACSFEESKKDIVSVETSESEGTKAISADNDSDVESQEDEEVPPTEAETEAPAADLPTIEEQVLWEVDGIKITATGISEDEFWGSAVDVLVENNSDKDVSIAVDALIVNDYMVTDLTYIEVTAGNKSNDQIMLLSSDFEAAGIENIGTIEMYMRIYDTATFETLNESGCITISTSDAENADTQADISGVTLYEQDGFKIVGQYVDENSFWGAAVLLYIENNTDKNVTLSGDGVAVNGFMVTASCYETIYAGKKAITPITLFSSDLEENGITSIDEIEVSFSAHDEDYNTVFSTDKIKFSAK